MIRAGQDGPRKATARNARSDAGNAMVVALLVLFVFTALGVTFIAVTKSEKQIAGNQMAASQAMYAAEAGLSEAVARMNNPKDPAYIGPVTPLPGWGRYVVEAGGASKYDPDLGVEQKDGLDNDGDGVADNSGEQYPEVKSAQLGLKETVGYPYVRVSFKTQGANLVRFGDDDNNSLTPPRENLTTGPPVLDVSARGVRGNASRVIDAVAYRYPLLDVRSAVWTGGSLKLNGNAFLVDGSDHYATGINDTIPGAPPTPGVMTEGPTTDASLTFGQGDNVLGQGGTSSVLQSPVTYDFNAIWNTISGMADATLPGGTTLSSSSPSLGTFADPKITCVNGNLKIQGAWTGAGILVVNGNLNMGGGSTFTGIVVVLGDVAVGGGGTSDAASIVGGLIYQGTLIDANSVGGAARIYYSSEAVAAANAMSRYQLAWWRER